MSGSPKRRAAGADWAFVSDASALVVAEELEPATADRPLPLVRVAHVTELRNTGGPRDPRDVAGAFCRELARWKVDALASDSHYRASWEPVLADANVNWIPAPVKAADISMTFLALRLLLHSDRLLLPPLPRLRKQLMDLQARATAAALVVASKRRKEEGGTTSHGDIVSALVLAVWQLAQHGADYRHAGIRSRVDVLRRGGERRESFAGIPSSDMHDLAEDAHPD